MSIDVLFIHPGYQKKAYQALSDEFTAIAPPVWSLLIANYLRNKGREVAIYDANVEGWNEEIGKKVIKKYQPKLIVILVYGHHPSASTQVMPVAGKIAKDIKQYNKDFLIAMGGTHPSALPKKTLEEEAIDFVIQGEGVYTIEGLVQFVKGKQELKKIEGLWFRQNKEIQSTSQFRIVQNLDEELDDYAWDLLSGLDHYRAHNMHCFQEARHSKRDDLLDVRTPYVTMNTSLGCPYSCHYCCIHSIFGKPSIRYWSVEKVISWLDVLVNQYHVKNIRFDDELFILSPQRIERLCDLIIERKYDLNIFVYGRVDTIRESLLKKMKLAGIHWICLGIESANDRVRQDVNKMIKPDVKEVVRMIQAHDIYILGNYMFGLPEDNLATMQETFNQAQELNCEFVNFYTVMAFPGSQLYTRAAKQKNILPDNWEGFGQHSYHTQPLATRYLSAQEILMFRDKVFYEYYKNPLYLEMVKNKFGERVQKHIERMVHIPLKRKLLEEILVT